jgi:multidrug resistance efflux pump
VGASAELERAVARLREAGEKLQKARLPADEGKVAVVRRALELAEKDFAVRREELALKRAAKRGEADGTRIELANLGLERQQAVLRAPMDGVVTFGSVKVGDVLEPGKAVVEIAEQAGFRFEALVPSEEVANLRVGMPARIKLDAYDYQRYGTLSGTVCFVAPDSGVAEGHPGAFYLVRIEVADAEVGRGDLRGPVRLGMAGQVEIVTDRESVLSLLTQKIRRTISLG